MDIISEYCTSHVHIYTTAHIYTYMYMYNVHVCNSHSLAEDLDGNERCVSQQELAEVRRELQSRVDQLQGQLTYWQNTTLTVIKDHATTGEVDVHVLCIG